MNRSTFWTALSVLALGACGGGSADVADLDQDGVSIADGDCDDLRANVKPGATEVTYNGFDDDCDTTTRDDDLDSDGWVKGADCNDDDDSVFPGADEIVGDHIDQDCSGSDATSTSSGAVDADGDGWPAGLDCNDNEDGIFPGADDIAGDHIDQDCSGSDASAASSAVDADHDGWVDGPDCNDDDDSIFPGADEVPNDGIDQDCSGSDRTELGSVELPFASATFYTESIVTTPSVSGAGVVSFSSTNNPGGHYAPFAVLTKHQRGMTSNEFWTASLGDITGATSGYSTITASSIAGGGSKYAVLAWLRDGFYYDLLAWVVDADGAHAVGPLLLSDDAEVQWGASVMYTGTQFVAVWSEANFMGTATCSRPISTSGVLGTRATIRSMFSPFAPGTGPLRAAANIGDEAVLLHDAQAFRGVAAMRVRLSDGHVVASDIANDLFDNATSIEAGSAGYLIMGGSDGVSYMTYLTSTGTFPWTATPFVTVSTALIDETSQARAVWTGTHFAVVWSGRSIASAPAYVYRSDVLPSGAYDSAPHVEWSSDVPNIYGAEWDGTTLYYLAQHTRPVTAYSTP